VADAVSRTVTKQQKPWGSIALVVILVAFGAWLVMHLEWQEETTRSGFSGEARHNPYHAGMLLLTQSGYPAKRLDDAVALDGLAAHSTLLLNSPALFNNRKQAAKLMDWVKRGGHLVLPLTRHSDPDSLLQALGIHAAGWNQSSAKQQMIGVERMPLMADLRDAVIFDIEATPEWIVTLTGYFDTSQASTNDASEEEEKDSQEDADAQLAPKRPFHTDATTKVPVQRRESHAVYARWKLGQGYVTTGDLSSFRNSDIDRNDHATLFMHLMTLPKDTRPVFVALTAQYPGLGAWLVQHAGEALIALAVLLAAILWRAMPRFGPQLPDIAPRRPGLLEHLSAVGDFLLREKQYEALIAPLREDVVIRLTHLRGRHPEITSLPELGAHIAKLDVRDVTLALTPEPADAHEFQRRSRTLATLRHHCSSMQNTFSPEGSQT